MRILFVTAHKHLPELRGGLEVNTDELAKRMQRIGHTVGVLCGLAGKGFVGLRARIGIKIFLNKCPRDSSLGYSTWRSWKPVEYISQVVQVFKPDVIIIQGGAEFNPILGECLKNGIPVICYFHTADELPLERALLENKNLYFVSNSLFTKSLHRHKNISCVLRPLVDSKRYKTETDRSAAVFINPAKHKGLDLVLLLAKARRDIPFIFVINQVGEKERIIKDFGLVEYPNISVLGPFSDMRQIYRRAKIVLAPSQCLETWGRIATEAHFSGIPVLASSRGGLPEAVGPGGICLSDDAPILSWIEALSDIWDNKTRYADLCKAATEFSKRTEIDHEYIVQNFLNLISNAVYFDSKKNAA